MRPIFTIHAGEYLVGLHVEEKLKLNVWIPAKDTGIDLLVTDRENRCTVSVQVKHGKDFVPGVLRDSLRCLSWFSLNRDKLNASRAEFWVFVLQGFKSNAPDFVVIPKMELQRRMTEIHGSKGKTIQSYFCSTESNRCWEARGLRKNIMLQIAKGTYEEPGRDFTAYLNKNGWAALTKKLNR
jgi:hypothetical protein